MKRVLDGSYLRSLLQAFHVSVIILGGNGSAPDADPNHDVAEENEEQRQQIAQDDISHNEVDVLLVHGRPLLHAKLDLRMRGEKAL
jgi:hypothetical protein